MNAPLRKTLTLSLTAIIAAFSLSSAFGQAVRVTGEEPVFDDLPSPQFAGVKNKRFSPLDWLEIEAKLKIEMKPEPKSQTCDKLTMKWYVAVKNPDKAGTYFLLTKDVEHVNLPLNEEVYCSAYLSPASLRRITGSPRGGKGAVERVGYEAFINGEKVYSTTKKGDTDWWNVASEKISRSEAVPLLSKKETPFRDMWWDRYPEISVERP
jgi:hypothetical protein